ncbi:unnamed protein product, partial [Closterium sp. NIES-54]
APATATAATAATTAAATAATAAPACCTTMASLRVLAFDHEGRPVQFDTWLDDLQLYLLSDLKDMWCDCYKFSDGWTPAQGQEGRGAGGGRGRGRGGRGGRRGGAANMKSGDNDNDSSDDWFLGQLFFVSTQSSAGPEKVEGFEEPAAVGKQLMKEEMVAGIRVKGEPNERPLDEVVMDVVGPLNLGAARAEYFLTIVDVYTRVIWVYVLSKNSDVAETVKTDWLPMVERQQDRLMKAICTDRGGEFMSKDLSMWLKKNGIRHSLTKPYSPAMNGVDWKEAKGGYALGVRVHVHGARA